MEGVRRQVVAILVEQLGCKEDIRRDITFTDLGADSLVLVELIMAFEEESRSRSPTTRHSSFAR